LIVLAVSEPRYTNSQNDFLERFAPLQDKTSPENDSHKIGSVGKLVKGVDGADEGEKIR
jgi:hypothetical protein